jgi:membrane-associated HD superfamily phosphohydrolase
MSQEKDFKKLQQKTYRSYHQDGLVDIIIGLAIIGFGLNIAFDNAAFLFMGWLPIVLYVPMKNRITVPRVGYVKFQSSNKIVIGLVLAGLLVILLGLFVFVISGPDLLSEEMQDWLQQYYMLPLAVIAALCFTGAGLLTGITRLYVYALVFLFTFIVGNWLNLNPAIYVLSTGTVIEIVGLWLLARFLREHPLLEEGNANE